ncbi:VOC family protein [Dactylosporangium sp. NPDC049140]|uniref:VOC family protein n=1 Tax=Dactylosporangium sp. NPDC049140 TaxID=3155647 RepID=UPI00340BEADC
MSVQLNHTIVAARDKEASAEFLATMLGVPVGPRFGPFIPVEVSNGVTLDFMDTGGEPITAQHYAFLVSEDEFDAIFGRVQEAGVAFYADPHHNQPRQINHRDDGRGVYFDDPDGHNLEILTRPYGCGRR